MRQSSPALAWGGLLLFGSAWLACLYGLLGPRGYVRVDKKGIAVRGFLGSEQVPWSHVLSVDMAEAGGRKFVAVEYRKADRLRRQVATSLAIANGYDASIDEIFDALTQWVESPRARAPAPAPSPQAAHEAAAERALFNVIKERSASDPLIGAKLGSKEITQRLLEAMKTERGVHIESMLCALGALAGYACQAALRTRAADKALPPTSLLTTVQTSDGQTFYFGDPLNQLLAESEYSVWSVAAGGAQAAGCVDIPDLNDIFAHAATVVGTPLFGKPRVPTAHQPQRLPREYLRDFWPALRPVVAKFCPNADHWPVLFGLSAQALIADGKGLIDPCVALQLVMESAVPMSKVNLG